MIARILTLWFDESDVKLWFHGQEYISRRHDVPTYCEGDQVEYWSSKKQRWVRTQIESVRRSGHRPLFELTCKKGVDASCLRHHFTVGDSVEYWNAHMHKWIRAKITQDLDHSDLVQLDHDHYERRGRVRKPSAGHSYLAALTLHPAEHIAKRRLGSGLLQVLPTFRSCIRLVVAGISLLICLEIRLVRYTSSLAGLLNTTINATEATPKKSVSSFHKTNSSKACIALWNGSKVLGSDGAHTCNMRPLLVSEGDLPIMCLRNYPDQVSDRVIKYGTWKDCPSLDHWWMFLPDRSSKEVFGSFKPCGTNWGISAGIKLYVDIGANIGSCLVQMLARSDVQAALAFEPSPQNLFYLTSTLGANPKIKEKVMLYPIALGSEQERRPIFSEEGNAGNTVVGTPVHAVAHAAGHVTINRLDDILFQEGVLPPYIHLMKIDAQGFEGKIMQGAHKLFASGAVNAVQLEIATDWLKKQGTSPQEYLNMFLQYGFQLHDTDSKQVLSQRDLESVACGPAIVKDFVAVLKAKKEASTQAQIMCA